MTGANGAEPLEDGLADAAIEVAVERERDQVAAEAARVDERRAGDDTRLARLARGQDDAGALRARGHERDRTSVQLGTAQPLGLDRKGIDGQMKDGAFHGDNRRDLGVKAHEPDQDASDLDARRGNVNGFERRVRGTKLDLGAAAEEALQRRLAFHDRDDGGAVVRLHRPAHQHQIAVPDPVLDHRVPRTRSA